MIPRDLLQSWRHALPFYVSFLLIPLVWIGAAAGGLWLLIVPLVTWWVFTAADGLLGITAENADPQTPDAALTLYRRLTMLWVPAQFISLYALIWYVTRADHLSAFGAFAAFFGMGILTGTIGINYAHELMHQKSRKERFLADVLMAMALYSHFRSEHLLVHHRHVGTPRDAVTARYNEGFHRFFRRVLHQCFRSALSAEAAKQARAGRKATDLSNPFYRYAALQALMLALALIAGGWYGLALFLFQALTAIWQLELVNYVEHYGLTRKHLGEGRYEHVRPRHSWNATQKASNWLLINLQRHSDHHYKPDRRFPVLQNHSEEDAPQLPFGYPMMTMAAMIPPLWRRVMNPRVRAWRKTYYPEIADWQPYTRATNPMPR